MKEPIVVVGIGEMGSVFTRGFLRLGHPVYPVTRTTDIQKVHRALPEPALVLVAVGEHDLHATLKSLPASWRERIGLLQNELLPRDWQSHHIQQPTVIAVWFEKKKGQDYKVILPSPAYGPRAALLEDALEQLEIPCWELRDADELLYELVRKNVYILTINIAGLEVGGNVGELWRQHEALAREIAGEIIQIQEWLTGARLAHATLVEGMLEAFQGDLAHRCLGRTAPTRLERALTFADSAGLAVPRLRQIHAKAGAAALAL